MSYITTSDLRSRQPRLAPGPPREQQCSRATSSILIRLSLTVRAHDTVTRLSWLQAVHMTDKRERGRRTDDPALTGKVPALRQGRKGAGGRPLRNCTPQKPGFWASPVSGKISGETRLLFRRNRVSAGGNPVGQPGWGQKPGFWSKLNTLLQWVDRGES